MQAAWWWSDTWKPYARHRSGGPLRAHVHQGQPPRPGWCAAPASWTLGNGDELKKPAILVLEDQNEDDKNAVCVYIDRLKVGCLARRLAKSYRDRLKVQQLPTGHYKCDALIVGGWDRGGATRDISVCG